MATSIAVFGAGSWGTALAISLVSARHDVTLWARRAEAAEAMQRNRHNPVYLPEASLPEQLKLTSDLEAAARNKDLWLIATPSHAVRELAERLLSYLHRDLIVVSVAKGIENDTLYTTSQVLAEVLEPLDAERIGVLYGPSHAEEVATGRPTTVVAAAPSIEVAEQIQSLFMTPELRVYVNDDVLGVEIGGSVKNVMAIAAGMSDGIGYGDNAKAAIITRGMAEIQRLGIAMGAQASTFSGLTGIGDLVVTCTSQHSRNRYLGEQIGQGKTLEEVQRDMKMVAEGVKTTASVYALAQKYHIEMPITEAVYAILFEGKKPKDAVLELMTRSAKQEDWLPDRLQGYVS
ncbi:MAG TPA: NAD(P)H-dependent glycerol-3-phosphate dehydrogenase [Rhodothermales bacterium]|nr:NAD(P)H-dependent glycerol-3-phosphate dehydrogenase [Rhodothermales bacterium]